MRCLHFWRPRHLHKPPLFVLPKGYPVWDCHGCQPCCRVCAIGGVA